MSLFTDDFDDSQIGLLTGAPQWAADGTLSFPSESWAEIPSTPKLNAISNALTISIWFRRTQPGGAYQQIVGRQKGSSSTDQFLLGFVNESYLFTLGTNTNFEAVTSDVKNDGQWTHILGAYDGSQMKLYINGSLKSAKSISGSLVNEGKRIVLGAGDNGGSLPDEHFNGDIDNFTIFDRALSDTEILALYIDQKP